MQPRPNAKKGKTYSTIPRLCYDSLNEICLCLIWDDATGKHETWTFDVAKLQWTKMEPSLEPEPSMSRSRNMSFSPEHNVFILDLNPSALKGKGRHDTWRPGCDWEARCGRTPPGEPAASLSTAGN